MIYKNIVVGTTLFVVLSALPLIKVTPGRAEITVKDAVGNFFPTPASIALANKSELIKSGKFETLAQKTSGNVRLVREKNGRLYIDFDKKFRTESGPDLFVVLSVSRDLKNAPIADEIYYTVSPVLRVQGEQRYILPSDFNLNTYQSIAIWDRSSNTLYGAASWQ